MRLKAFRAARDAAAEAERPFNVRSTRESVCRSILKGEALTLEQYRVAETRDLVGSGITNAPVEAMPIAYDGPHQFRWDPGSWQGFVNGRHIRWFGPHGGRIPPLVADSGIGLLRQRCRPICVQSA